MSRIRHHVAVGLFLGLFLCTTTAPVAFAQHEHDNDRQQAALAHLQRGNDAYAYGDLNFAAEQYESCLELSPSLQWCLVNLGSVLVDLNTDLSRAERLYRQALESDPTDGDAAFNLALLLQDRKTEEHTREASALYKIAVKADPRRWDAWANLASSLSELKEEPLRAVHAFERSILLIEGNVDEEDEHEENIAGDAYLSKLYYGYGLELAGLSPEACSIIAKSSQSLLIGKERASDDGEGITAGGELCLENAQNALRTACALDPKNVQASHMLAALMSNSGGENNDEDGELSTLRRATPEFVAALFDDFADTFDTKLGALEYKVPGLVGAAASRAAARRRRSGEGGGGEGTFGSALDAGCGTGLAGRYLRPLVSGPLIGVDISRKMLSVAAQCTTVAGCGLADENAATTDESMDGGAEEEAASAEPLYDGLFPLDLETMTIEETLRSPSVVSASSSSGAFFDLVVAADVLVYFGKLDVLLHNFATLSLPDASLIFSCERATPEDAPAGWKLLSSGRFAHTKPYVVNVATDCGYDLVEYEEIVPRMEKGVEVQGHLFSFVLRSSSDQISDEL